MSAYRQLPSGDQVFFDHLAHWVPDLGAANDALQALGFTTTPATPHTHSSSPGAPPVPAGSTNQCVMLREGYIEVLTPTADTPIGRELSAGIDRYVGVHLAAMAVTDAARERERLVAGGFAQRPLVALERDIDTPAARAAKLRFTVVRPEVGAVPEGRVQYLTHHTPDLLWQPRWLDHPNTATRLTGLVICVPDPQEARARYRAYLGREPVTIEGGSVFDLDRGSLALIGPDRLRSVLPELDISALPCMAAYALECRSLDKVRARLSAAGIRPHGDDGAVLRVMAPAVLGGSISFAEPGTRVSWLS